MNDVQKHGVLAGQTWRTAGGALVYVSQTEMVAAQVVRAGDKFTYAVRREDGQYIAPVDIHYKKRVALLPLETYVRGPSLQGHTTAPTEEEDEAWKEREARMDMVGQNGNDGDHYPPGTISMEVPSATSALPQFSAYGSNVLVDSLKGTLREFEKEYEAELGVSNKATEASDPRDLHDRTLRFLDDVRAEVIRARSKFAGEDNLTGLALAEEFGEVIKAVLDESSDNVRKEAVQTAAMACRLATEGDPTVKEWRRKKGLNALNDGGL